MLQTAMPPSNPYTVFDEQKGDEMYGLDFETRCELDLTQVGLDRYVNHPSFEVLLAGISNASGTVTYLFDFVNKPENFDDFRRIVEDQMHFAAHNAPFERAVLKQMGMYLDGIRIYDTAVMSRGMGGASRLANAAPQLVNFQKMTEGKDLIRMFSTEQYIGGKMTPEFTKMYYHQWTTFGTYCLVDAQASAKIVELSEITSGSYSYNEDQITQLMNDNGWHVDMDSVHHMWRRYQENLEILQQEFLQQHPDAADLNLNSLPQLKAWCREHKVVATSFDEKNVEKLLKKVEAKLADPAIQEDRVDHYTAVRDLLKLKQQLGGSSLKKLKVIMDTIGEDGRLRNQYMHVGAGQTFRTSGRGVQMQNLKRMVNQKDMSTLADPSVEWTNEELAENLRQVFTAEDPKGYLVVGDFSAVEARALPYLAGQQWKVDAFREGKDMYKVQAADIFGIKYENVTKEQRRTGKVGELSCGYGAGAGAVMRFAEGMHVDMSQEEAQDLVTKWRQSNADIVRLWQTLDDLLHQALAGKREFGTAIGYDLSVSIGPIATPPTLSAIHPGAQSLSMDLRRYDGSLILRRVFHGCYENGGDVMYYKASESNTKLWSRYYRNQTTKQYEPYKIYGGKLAGILTQSFCREIFFDTLKAVEDYCAYEGLKLIGQFHDEIIVEVTPDLTNGHDYQDQVVAEIRSLMEIVNYRAFPLDADVNADYRYTK